MQSPPPRPLLEQPLVRGAIAAVLLGVLAGALLLARSRDDDAGGGPTLEGAPSRTARETATPDADVGALDEGPPIRGEPAPDFALRDLDGRVVKLSDLRGSVVFVNFWASWCRPCRKELPAIQRLYEEKRHEGLVVLAVNYQDPPDVAAEYAESLGLTAPLLLDRSGAVFEQYRLQGLPDSFFIDREGRIAALQFGELSESKMRERLRAAGLP